MRRDMEHIPSLAAFSPAVQKFISCFVAYTQKRRGLIVLFGTSKIGSSHAGMAIAELYLSGETGSVAPYLEPYL
jgi:hypothetical protein